MQDHVTKPIDPDALAAAIARLVAEFLGRKCGSKTPAAEQTMNGATREAHWTMRC